MSQKYGLLASTEFRVCSVGQSVRLLVTTVNSGKTADSIDVPFAPVVRARPRDDLLNGNPFCVKWGGTM